MAFQLDRRAPLDRELLRVIRWQIADAARESISTKCSVAERIHHARSSCKKVRAALLLIRGSCPQLYARENAWFRDSARRLARFRDVDVMLACVGEFLAKTPARQPARPFLLAVRGRLLARQRHERSGHASLRRELVRFGRRMRSAHRRLAGVKLKGVHCDEVMAGFATTYRRSRRSMPAADTHAAARFHQWRKWTKSCAYQCRLLRVAWPPVMKVLWHEFSELGDTLGAEHDLSLLREYLKHPDDPAHDAPGAAAGIRLVEQRRAHHRHAAIALGRKLLADKPRAVAHRMRRWWLSGQA